MVNLSLDHIQLCVYMFKNAINFPFFTKKREEKEEKALSMVYFFSHFYRPTVFPLTRKN